MVVFWAPGFGTYQLVHHLKHGTLHLVIAASTVIEASAANSVHLVEENDARLQTQQSQPLGRVQHSEHEGAVSCARAEGSALPTAMLEQRARARTFLERAI